MRDRAVPLTPLIAADMARLSAASSAVVNAKTVSEIDEAMGNLESLNKSDDVMFYIRQKYNELRRMLRSKEEQRG